MENNRETIKIFKKVLKETIAIRKFEKTTSRLSKVSRPEKIEMFRNKLIKISAHMKYENNKSFLLVDKDYISIKDKITNDLTLLHIIYHKIRGTSKTHLGSKEKDLKYFNDRKYEVEKIMKVIGKIVEDNSIIQFKNEVVNV